MYVCMHIIMNTVVSDKFDIENCDPICENPT